MGLRLEKVKAEFEDWWDELYVENHVLKRRYGKPKEWLHLLVDIPNATFEHLHYTLSHVFWPVVIYLVWVHL